MNEKSEQKIANHLLEEFNSFYQEFLEIPDKAKAAFESRLHQESLRLSSLRLGLYSGSIKKESSLITEMFSYVKEDEKRWIGVEFCFKKMVEGEYHADLALAYIHSVRRKIYASEWLSEDYASRDIRRLDDSQYDECFYRRDIQGVVPRDMVFQILQLESFSTHFQDIRRDVELIVNRLEKNIKAYDRQGPGPISIEVFKAGFYRNRGAYLVGRFNYKDGRHRPLIIALLNGKAGIYVDAVINSSTYAHNMFSSTLANIHVTNDYYHEVCLFLKSIMPKRPLGLHYSTIGYNHLGKVAVMKEIEDQISSSGEQFAISPGARGTVAIGFSTPGSAYHAKVIRNVPTDGYKWDEYHGVDWVLKKYTRVHDINRSDSMLDNIIFYKIRLPKCWFDQELLDELLGFANESVWDEGEFLLFRYLIVQRKMTPLPVYLETASEKLAENAMINLGYCIKNNAAANIFNKDLDARNYGVTAFAKIYLYDYDAIESLGDVKIRTNLDRFDGEEDIPDWYFEDGYVFLPEELPSGLCLRDQRLRKIFDRKHSELLAMDYWESVQNRLAAGKVPRVSVYPDSERVSSI